MELSVDDIVSGALRVLKKQPETQIVILRNGPATELVGQCFQYLGIDYFIKESDTEQLENTKPKYTIDLPAIQIKAKVPDYESLKEYWKPALVPKIL